MFNVKSGVYTKNRHSEAGFIMFTIPVILVLFTFFVASITRESKPNNFYFETSTQTKMEDVKTSLAAYAHRKYRVPCPSDPAAAVSFLGQEDVNVAAGNCNRNMGILPFKELGLTQDYAKDEWGNFLTYKISPDFARVVTENDFDPVDGVGGANVLLVGKEDDGASYVHEICRTQAWVDDSVASYRDNDGTLQQIGTNPGDTKTISQNIFKARFCCPSNVSDGGGSTFNAEDQAVHNGKKVADLADENGVPQNEIIMTMEGMDHVALWEWAKNSNKQNFYQNYTYNEYIDFVEEWSSNQTFDYNDDIGDHVANDGALHAWTGFGAKTTNSHSGKFWRNAAVFDVVTENVKIKEFTMNMSDIGENNNNAPVEIAMDVSASIDHDDDPDTPNEITKIDTVRFVAALPDLENTSYGIGLMPISVDIFKGESDQDSLMNANTPAQKWMLDQNRDLSGKTTEYYATRSEALFDSSKASLEAKLTAAGLTIDDLIIDRLKVNATHSSIAFSDITYGSTGTPVDTDLIGEDEGGTRILNSRGGASAGGAFESTTNMHAASTEVAQDFEAPAYVLISHGANGEGAYLGDSTANQINALLPADENESEQINFIDDNRYRTSRKVVSNDTTEYFDDIVMWDSQISLYNSLRNGTCEASQAL